MSIFFVTELGGETFKKEIKKVADGISFSVGNFLTVGYLENLKAKITYIVHHSLEHSSVLDSTIFVEISTKGLVLEEVRKCLILNKWRKKT